MEAVEEHTRHYTKDDSKQGKRYKDTKLTLSMESPPPRLSREVDVIGALTMVFRHVVARVV